MYMTLIDVNTTTTPRSFPVGTNHSFIPVQLGHYTLGRPGLWSSCRPWYERVTITNRPGQENQYIGHPMFRVPLKLIACLLALKAGWLLLLLLLPSFRF